MAVSGTLRASALGVGIGIWYRAEDRFPRYPAVLSARLSFLREVPQRASVYASCDEPQRLPKPFLKHCND